MSRELKAGTVWINTWGYVNDGFEDEGCKQSGYGAPAGHVQWKTSKESKLAPNQFNWKNHTSSGQYPEAFASNGFLDLYATDPPMLLFYLYVRMGVRRTVSQTVVALDFVR